MPTQKQRREAAVKVGLCCVCCIRPKADGCKQCEHCIIAKRERTALRELERAQHDGWCDECIASGFHRWDCSTRTRVA